MIVEAAEGTSDVGALFFLHLEHQLPYVGWHWVHSECIQSPFQHVGLNARLVERSRPFADSHVRILSEKQVHLLECASVSFHAVETAHVYDCWRHSHQLIHPWDIFTGGLPHVPVHQGKLYFFCHNSLIYFDKYNKNHAIK